MAIVFIANGMFDDFYDLLVTYFPVQSEYNAISSLLQDLSNQLDDFYVAQNQELSLHDLKSKLYNSRKIIEILQ
jgi:hypothetical protein